MDNRKRNIWDPYNKENDDIDIVDLTTNKRLKKGDPTIGRGGLGGEKDREGGGERGGSYGEYVTGHTRLERGGRKEACLYAMNNEL